MPSKRKKMKQEKRKKEGRRVREQSRPRALLHIILNHMRITQILTALTHITIVNRAIVLTHT